MNDKPSEKVPTEPGWYWALWLTAAKGTYRGEALTPSPDWGIVGVWRNWAVEHDAEDRREKFCVSVPGIREAQWLENFKWGERIPDRTGNNLFVDLGGEA